MKIRKQFKLYGYLGTRRASESDAGNPDMIFKGKEGGVVLYTVSERALGLQTRIGRYVITDFNRGTWMAQLMGTKVHIRIKGTVATVVYWA